MSEIRDPELKALLAGLDPETRKEVLEAHRLLEHDLSRLVDPLPPPGFLQGVMAKVAAAPERAPSRREQAIAAFIVVATSAAGLGALSFGGVALAFTRFALAARELVLGLGTALSALWRTSALPLSVMLSLTLLGTLVALRRMALPAPEVAR